LLIIVSVVALVAAGLSVFLGTRGANAPEQAAPATSSSTPATGTFLAADGVKSAAIIAENQKPGSSGWVIPAKHNAGIAGFADHVYASVGQAVTLFVSTAAATFHVEAYRVGYYGGAGARLVWLSARLPGRAQPKCPVTPGVNMVSCDNWAPSVTVAITSAYPQGDYLFKLVGSGDQQSYVPLTVWDPNGHGAYLFKNDVFTWQAWNPYGGFDYYQGVGACPPNVYPLCSRARVVSYDRPYGDEDGTGDFMWLELPLVRMMEQDGLDVSYATDITVAEHPGLLADHRALLSLGHDECWSLPERTAVTAAESHGLNLAFFGASGMLRHVRSQASPMGADRELVDYRDSNADPLHGHGDPRQVTGNTWASPPASWPETDFVGEDYNGFLEPAVHANLTVTDAAAWFYQGAGLHNGSVLAAVIGSDVDSLEPDPAGGHPADVQVLAHSALPANKAQPGTRSGNTFFSDVTYYSDPAGGAGVWDSGTNNWIPALAAGSGETAATAATMRLITGNLFHLIGQGPAGRVRPSVPNWQQTYPKRQ
jgi:hypothetical protein